MSDNESQCTVARLNALSATKLRYEGQLRRFSDYLAQNAADTSQLKVRLSAVTPILSQYLNIVHEISNISDADISDDISNFESLYFSVLSVANGRLSDSGSSSSTNVSEHGYNFAQRTSSLKKPNIPTFDGSIENWMSFRQMFNCIVHADRSLSSVQKLFYLKSALKGNAAALLQNLELTNENYPAALEILSEHFDNQRVIVDKHVSFLVNLPDVCTEESTRKLIIQVQQACHALDALKVETKTWDPILIFLITSKFDKETLSEWEKVAFKKECPTKSQLFDFLERRCQVLRALTVSTLPNDQREQGKSLKNSTKIGNSFRCPLCNQAHKIYQCPEFLSMSVRSRIVKAKNLGLCLNCLRKHEEKCSSVRTCYECSRKHHTSLHLPQSTNQEVVLYSKSKSS